MKSIDEMQADWNARWRRKRRWIVVEEGDGIYTVHQHSADGVAPPAEYPDVLRAAARLLQLLGLRAPVAPQDHPEEVCVGQVACGQPPPDAPHATGPVRCVGCGHRWVAVVPAEPPQYQPDTGALDMLECPRCGQYLGCSE